MLYLATPSTTAAVDAMAVGLLGMIDTPYQGGIHVDDAHARSVRWCADNGAYTARWDADVWWAWLNAPRQLDHLDRCLFATAPDVVGDAAATAVRAAPWLEPMRTLGYPVAYVAQDGATSLPWDDLDVVFLGGTTDWKLGPAARALTAEAIGRGKPVHCGRVNSARRWAYAEAIGCSTADGTYLVFGPDVNLPRLLRWTGPNPQSALELTL